MDNSINSNINCDDERYSKGNEFYCEHYCSNKLNLHTHNQKDYDSFKGVNMKEITSKFQVDTMTFVRVFPCEECDTKSCGMDEHKKHFEKDHKDMQYEHGCLFNSCEFKAFLPEQIIIFFYRST